MPNKVINLTILETTDIHCHLTNYDYLTGDWEDQFGLVRTASLIKQVKEQQKNVLLFDNGDLLQGNPMGDFAVEKNLVAQSVHPAYKIMNHLGYDAGNIGNHEFNYGLTFLEKAIAGARFPYVCSNLFHASNPEKPYFSPYIVLNRIFTDTSGNPHPLKIGILGLVPPQIMEWDRQYLQGKVIAKDMYESAKIWIPKLQEEGADLIIAIAHSGLDPNGLYSGAENQAYKLSYLPELSAILFGHTHTVFPGKDYEGIAGIDLHKGTVNGTAAVQPGFWGNHLGKIDLTIEKLYGKWRMVESQSETLPIFNYSMQLPLVKTDKISFELIKDEHEQTIEFMNNRIGFCDTPIYSFFSQVEDSLPIQLVNEAQKWFVEKNIIGTELEELPVLAATAPFKAGRDGVTDYTFIEQGELSLKDAFSLYRHPNTLCAVKLSGAEIIEWLEWSAGQFFHICLETEKPQWLVKENKSAEPGFPSYQFDIIHGISYEIDVTAPVRYNLLGNKINDSHRIKNVTFKGQPLNRDDLFLVATNNYRASTTTLACPTQEQLVFQAPTEVREVVLQYLKSCRISFHHQKQWRIASMNPKGPLLFLSSPKGKEFSIKHPTIKYVEQHESGYGIFEYLTNE